MMIVEYQDRVRVDLGKGDKRYIPSFLPFLTGDEGLCSVGNHCADCVT